MDKLKQLEELITERKILAIKNQEILANIYELNNKYEIELGTLNNNRDFLRNYHNNDLLQKIDNLCNEIKIECILNDLDVPSAVSSEISNKNYFGRNEL